MDALAAHLLTIADWITAHITMWVLIATGLFLTVVTRGVQVRHLGDMVRQVGAEGRHHEGRADPGATDREARSGQSREALRLRPDRRVWAPRSARRSR